MPFTLLIFVLSWQGDDEGGYSGGDGGGHHERAGG